MNLLQQSFRPVPAVIANLNLEFVRLKLLDDDVREAARRHGERLWTVDRSLRAIEEYRQFLTLMSRHPESILVPSADIDEIWHLHVLHTAIYMADCQRIFGRYQHHAPNFGESQDVLAQDAQSRQETMRLFEEEFGAIPESYQDDDLLKCSGRCSGRCRGR